MLADFKTTHYTAVYSCTTLRPDIKLQTMLLLFIIWRVRHLQHRCLEVLNHTLQTLREDKLAHIQQTNKFNNSFITAKTQQMEMFAAYITHVVVPCAGDLR